MLLLVEVEEVLIEELVEEVLIEVELLVLEVEVVVDTGANTSTVISPQGEAAPRVAFIVTLVPLTAVVAFCLSEATVENPPALALEPSLVWLVPAVIV